MLSYLFPSLKCIVSSCILLPFSSVNLLKSVLTTLTSSQTIYFYFYPTVLHHFLPTEVYSLIINRPFNLPLVSFVFYFFIDFYHSYFNFFLHIPPVHFPSLLPFPKVTLLFSGHGSCDAVFIDNFSAL